MDPEMNRPISQHLFRWAAQQEEMALAMLGIASIVNPPYDPDDNGLYVAIENLAAYARTALVGVRILLETGNRFKDAGR